jgi:antitoxin component HigA of HigAB toxin-antitoxin module
MSIAINRKSFEIVENANTPDYDKANWIINPDLSKVQGMPKKYWMVRGDEIVPVTEQARAKIDEAGIDKLKDERCEEFKSNTHLAIQSGFEFPANSGKRVKLSEADRITVLCLAKLDFEPETYPVGLVDSDITLNATDDAYALIQADAAHRIGMKKSESELMRRVREAQTVEAVNFVADRRV